MSWHGPNKDPDGIVTTGLVVTPQLTTTSPFKLGQEPDVRWHVNVSSALAEQMFRDEHSTHHIRQNHFPLNPNVR